MSLQSALFDIDDLHSFSDLSTFAQHIPVEWVASALELSSSATIRRRRLPTDQVLWLVLGMALFRNEPVSEVARRLNICTQGLSNDKLLARSGVSQARQRLGAQPLQWLFRQTGQCWGKERYPKDDRHGLQVLAADGAVLRTPDTPALREHFGSGNTGTDRQTPFPMMRLVALMNVRSPIVLDAQLSPYRRSEIRLADTFVDRIPDHSITLLDKGFWSADLLLHLADGDQQRHWLIPARKGLVWETLETYNADDQLLRMRVSPQARKRNPELPVVWDVRAVSYMHKGKRRTVYTSLPVAHGYDPARVRFKFAYQYIAAQLIVMAAAQPLSRTGARLTELRAGVGNLFLDKRPRPSRPRSVKISKTRYPVNRQAAPLK